MANRGRKVLVVDDQPASLEICLDILRALSVECIGADSGAAALEKFKVEEIGLVITDVRMPFLKDKSPDLPVVLVSGYNIEESELASATAQADQILAKPYRMSDIVDILQRFLRS
jgi:CheY-like chemotaxis protein